ncbi:MAG TPA: hypothetical protein VFN88_09105 [Caulobacteraceae bacterium]|nr:hypothetical protein [Caulobacteraceae bacterium]
MFDIGREFRRLFKPQGAFAPPRDGLTGGDAALLELLDLDMLKSEAKAADVAAGRVGVKDRGERCLQQCAVWRELARRTGDAEALRKAALCAEQAQIQFLKQKRLKGMAIARLEQGRCAVLGAELFGDEGLNAAADVALGEAAETGDKALAASAALTRARIEVMNAIAQADAERTFLALANCERLAPVPGGARTDRAGRLDAAKARADVAEAICAAGERFSDERLVERAIAMLSVLTQGLDAAYEPLTWARAGLLRGRALVVLGELTGEAGQIVEAVSQLTEVIDTVSRDHSPLDWAAAQLELARALEALSIAADAGAIERAVNAYDRALLVLKRRPDLRQRAAAGINRALAVARRAEASPDRHAMDEAEANFRCELASADPAHDPAWWAVCQVALARIYEVRLARFSDRLARQRALFALTEALEVFSVQGLRELADVAVSAMDRLQARRPVGR